MLGYDDKKVGRAQAARRGGTRGGSLTRGPLRLPAKSRGGGPGEMGNNLPTLALGNPQAGQVTKLYMAQHHACVIRSGRVKCTIDLPLAWRGAGRGNSAQPADSWFPALSTWAGWGSNVDSMGALGTMDDSVYGWGEAGEGYTRRTMSSLPHVSLGSGEYSVKSLSLSQHRTCAILSPFDGSPNSLKCWGYGSAPVCTTLPDGTKQGCYCDMQSGCEPGWRDLVNLHGVGPMSNEARPGANNKPGTMGNSLQAMNLGIYGTDREAQGMLVGDEWTCVVLDNYGAKCWGWANHTLGYGDRKARLGPGHIDPDPKQTELPYLDVNWTFPMKWRAAEEGALPSHPHGTAAAVAVGSGATCARFVWGGASCWGGGEGRWARWSDSATSYGVVAGNLTVYGDGNVERGLTKGLMGQNLPFLNFGSGRLVKDLQLNGMSVCAILEPDDRLKCVGVNDNGELGLGDRKRRGHTPATVGDALPFVDVSAALRPSRE